MRVLFEKIVRNHYLRVAQFDLLITLIDIIQYEF
jgi:hypothetical protein